MPPTPALSCPTLWGGLRMEGAAGEGSVTTWAFVKWSGRLGMWGQDHVLPVGPRC